MRQIPKAPWIKQFCLSLFLLQEIPWNSFLNRLKCRSSHSTILILMAFSYLFKSLFVYNDFIHHILILGTSIFRLILVPKVLLLYKPSHADYIIFNAPLTGRKWSLNNLLSGPSATLLLKLWLNFVAYLWTCLNYVDDLRHHWLSFASWGQVVAFFIA